MRNRAGRGSYDSAAPAGRAAGEKAGKTIRRRSGAKRILVRKRNIAEDRGGSGRKKSQDRLSKNTVTDAEGADHQASGIPAGSVKRGAKGCRDGANEGGVGKDKRGRGKERRRLEKIARNTPHAVMVDSKPDRVVQRPLTFALVRPDSLKLYERRLRTVDKIGDAQMDANVRENRGILVPLLVSRRTRTVIAGERRLASALRVGLDVVPVVYVEDLTELEARKFRIADNMLQEGGRWNLKELSPEFRELVIEQPDLNISAMGCSIGRFDVVIAYGDDLEAPKADKLHQAAERPVSRPGDVFRLGHCVLVCGDAREIEVYRLILGSERASLVLTDVPFNLVIDGHVSVRGRKRGARREFVMASGEMSPEEFIAFNAAWMRQAARVLRPGSLVYSAINAKGLHDLESAAREAGLEHINTCVWDKGAGGMGSFYRSQVEFYPFWKVPGAKMRNNVELGRHGRNRTTCWAYPGLNVGGADRDRLLAMHPTPKPVAMLKEAIMDSTARGEIVLDPFAGSGSTLIAAVAAGRRAALIELDPGYVDTIIARAQEELGIEAVHVETGNSFKSLARMRGAEDEA